MVRVAARLTTNRQLPTTNYQPPTTNFPPPMIVINCTHCQQRLEMDEAFAGGVCRCQYCRTIQTVPSHLKKPSPGAAAAKSVHPAGGSGTGLDDLADVVASSGLSRNGLTKAGRSPQRSVAGRAAATGPSSATVDYATPKRRQKSSLVPAFIAGGAALLVLLGVVAYLRFPRTTTSLVTPVPVIPQPDRRGAALPDRHDGESLTISGPAFGDVPLTSNSVVYLIDRSQANAELLDTLKASIYYSALSLGPQGKFQIVFWSHNEEGIVAYPEEGLAPATDQEVDSAGERFQDVIGYGNTDLKPALEKAVSTNPDAIVIATAKVYIEDESLAVFDAALQGTPIKVHAISLGETESPVLKRIAEKTGGSYRALSPRQLHKLMYHVPGSGKPAP